eukprot:6185557-Pleurochrysis_carterae.AAC.1
MLTKYNSHCTEAGKIQSKGRPLSVRDWARLRVRRVPEPASSPVPNRSVGRVLSAKPTAPVLQGLSDGRVGGPDANPRSRSWTPSLGASSPPRPSAPQIRTRAYTGGMVGTGGSSTWLPPARALAPPSCVRARQSAATSRSHSTQVGRYVPLAKIAGVRGFNHKGGRVAHWTLHST